MPPDRPSRGLKTICVPCSAQEYEQVIDDSVKFRELLDRHIQATPELFPPLIHRGYRIKDVSSSRKTGCKLRRIELRNLDCYLVRPSFLMPDLAGRTEQVQAPLFSTSSPFPAGRSPRSSLATPCPGIAWNARWAASASSAPPSPRRRSSPATSSPTRSTPPPAARRCIWRLPPVRDVCWAWVWPKAPATMT